MKIRCEKQLHVVDDRRIWVIAEALRRKVDYKKIHEITKIDEWFIDKLAIIVEMEAGAAERAAHRRALCKKQNALSSRTK